MTAGPVTRRTAAAMVKALTKGGREQVEAGVSTADLDSAILTGDGVLNRKQEAARWLREMGVPLIASRARHDSRWYVAPHDSDLHEEWVARILSDAYVETCRAYCALRPYEARRSSAKALKTAAMNLGTELGYELSEIEDALTPEAMPFGLKAMLVEIGVLQDA